MICKREGCNEELPLIAIKHGDPYCSTKCCKLDYGCYIDKDATAQNKKKPIKHGTPYAYKHRGCRCDSCREAATQRKRDQRARTRD